MSKKKQFAGTSKPRTFYDRKVLEYGYTRTISMGRIIPRGWAYVRVHVVKKEPTEITIRIEKLLGVTPNERRPENSKS